MFSLYGVVCTSAGVLIVSKYSAHKLFAITPGTATGSATGHGQGQIEQITVTGGTATGTTNDAVRIVWPLGLALNDADRMLYVGVVMRIKSSALMCRTNTLLHRTRTRDRIITGTGIFTTPCIGIGSVLYCLLYH